MISLSIPTREAVRAWRSGKNPPAARREVVVQRYAAGETVKQIADDLGEALGVVYKDLRYRGVPLRPCRRGPPSAPPDDKRAAEMVRLYDAGRGLTLQEIGERYGITRERVRQILRRAGVAGIGCGARSAQVGQKNAKAVAALCAEGKTAKEIAATIGISSSRVHTIARKYGMTLRTAAIRRPKGPKLPHVILALKLFDGGERDIRAISRRTGQTENACRGALYKHGRRFWTRP